ncbi:MAG: Xylulose kinase [Chlamydiia bacterium]|nr:Xylulose kinase [Chlamydiia bacterium]MCH9616033.1 Xylulose kinase [Chlamydiia bacterium]MCH9629056.1 Xylulose kinase [Chlamydiia bacterium]
MEAFRPQMNLGIDLGTSSVKVVLLDDDLKLISEASMPLEVRRPHPNWSEQDPDEWFDATCDAIKQLGDVSGVKRIGLSGQMHGAVLLDGSHEPLRPAILWNDGRSEKECAILEAIPDVAQIVKNKIMPGFTAPKLLWVKEHEPDIFAKTEKVLLPKDYLRLKLTGEFATDVSDASGTMWLNMEQRKWSETMLSACDLTTDHMPLACEGPDVTGTLLPSIASELGLSPNVEVIAGGGDNAASAISMGVIKPHEAFLSLGTSGVYFVSASEAKANPEKGVHTFCHAVPNTYHHMSVMLSCANCLDWLAHLLKTPIDKLLQSAKKETNVLFLPYLSGERTPHNDPYARGVFFGMSLDTGPEDLVRAVLDGVALAFLDGQDAMESAKIAIKNVSVVGGGAKSLLWGEILASALGRPLHYRKHRSVGGAFGAAALCRYGKTPLLPEKIERTLEPNPVMRDSLLEKHPKFNTLYTQLKEVFR